MTKIFFFNFPNTLKGIKSFPIVLISSSCKEDCVVLFIWVLLSYFPTPGSSKVDKSLRSFVSRWVLVPDPLKTTVLPRFHFKGVIMLWVEEKDKHYPFSRYKRSRSGKSEGDKEMVQDFKGNGFPKRWRPSPFSPVAPLGGWPKQRRE